jgi:broad specificity phosphatase PhoE
MKNSLKNYCTIYIVRHGQTNWNLRKTIQGHQDIPLNKTGIRQAQQAAARLKKIKFDAAYSSDLVRAKQTAAIIALEHQLAVKTNQALRERAFGKLEGKTGSQYREELKDLLEKYESLTDKEKFKFQFPFGIETLESVMSRFIGFLRKIAIAHARQNVLVATHGGVMRHFLIHLGFATMSQLPHSTISNLAHIKLLCDGVDFFVKETYGVNLKNES